MTDTAVEYGPEHCIEPIKAGLARIGKTPETVTPMDLAPVDEFHIGGVGATMGLIDRFEPRPNAHVIDLGAGMGGPARLLAQRSGCQVTGVDLDAASVRAGNTLSAWVGLADKVVLDQGDVTALAYDDAEFDAAISIHVHMFLADKAALYREAARVLKPGAELAIFDPVLLDKAGFHYPVPWARDDTANFISTHDEMLAHLDEAGFDVRHDRDATDDAIGWFQETFRNAQATDGPPPLGLHLILGPEFPAMARNGYQNLQDKRIAMRELVCVRR